MSASQENKMKITRKQLRKVIREAVVAKNYEHIDEIKNEHIGRFILSLHSVKHIPTNRLEYMIKILNLAGPRGIISRFLDTYDKTVYIKSEEEAKMRYEEFRRSFLIDSIRSGN